MKNRRAHKVWKKNTGDEKGLSTFLWRVYSPHLLFSFSHHFGWCVFLCYYGRKLDDKNARKLRDY